MNFWSSATPYLAQIFADYRQCKNDADLYAIMQGFGVRKATGDSWSLCALISVNCDSFGLEEFTTTVLNSANVDGYQVSDLNAILSENGLTYQF